MKTRYLRLLSYPHACDVIDFINKNDKKDYANITTNGVSMQVSDKNWEKVLDYIKSLKSRYEVNDEPPHKTVENIISHLKANHKI